MQNNEKIRQPGERQWGIDLLRIVSIFMVIFLHASHDYGFYHSGAAASFRSAVPQQLLYILSYCAVNCFGMISGYVGLRGKFRISKVVAYVLQVAFLYFALAFAISALHGSFSLRSALDGFIGALGKGKEYWYVACYFAVLLLQPFLNLLIQTMNRKQHQWLLAAIFVLFCLVPSVPEDFFAVNQGYSPLWLVCLYFFGAYLARYGTRLNAWQCWLALGVSVLVVWGMCLLRAPRENPFNLIGYTRPTHVLNAFCLLTLCSRLKITKRLPVALIKFFAPAAFGVYLIHMQRNLKPILLDPAIGRWLHTFPGFWQLPLLLAACAAIFAVCTLPERLRILLFESVRKLMQK